MHQQENENHFNELARQLSKNVRHIEIVKIAIRHGWEIKPAGKEKVKACKNGYPSVSISGHNNGRVIPYNTAFRIIKKLLWPSSTEANSLNELKAHNESLQNELESERTRADKAESQLQQANLDIQRFKEDAETSFELAAETESINAALNKKIHEYDCWIQALKRKISSLIQQRAYQEREMLKIADDAEKQELQIQNSLKELSQLPTKRNPRLRQKLNHIIQILKGEIT